MELNEQLALLLSEARERTASILAPYDDAGKNVDAAFPIGGLVCILPAHSCLTVACMRRYVTLDGEMIEAMP